MPYDLLTGTEIQNSISMQTSKNNQIANSQNRVIAQQQIDFDLGFKQKYGIGTFFQGDQTSIYNCHGLTFASKRTGIFDDSAIRMILDDEYNEIQPNEVIVGDVVIYSSFDGNNKESFDHSAIVVEISNNGFRSIKVLSKTRFYKEIVHFVQYHPYREANYKFYRIKHEPITIN